VIPIPIPKIKPNFNLVFSQTKTTNDGSHLSNYPTPI